MLRFFIVIMVFDLFSLVDVEQFDVEQRHVLRLQDLLPGGRQFVLRRDQLHGVLHPHTELLVGEVATLLGIALFFAGGDVLRLGRHGVEIGRLHLPEQLLFETLPLQKAVRDGDARLVDRRAVLAVGEDRNAHREPDVLVEAVPDLRTAFERAARHVPGTDARGEGNGGKESCARLPDAQLRRFDGQLPAFDLGHGVQRRGIDFGFGGKG